MGLREKIEPSHLVVAILVQLIVLDMFLISFFIQQIRAKSYPLQNKNTSLASVKAVPRGYAPYRIAGSRPLDRLVKRVLSNAHQQDTLTFLQGSPWRKVLGHKENNIKSDPLMAAYSGLAAKGVVPDVSGQFYGLSEASTFIATSYDLSYASCGKYPSHPAYGITFSGRKAAKGRTVAVDPKVIPLGSWIHIEFPAPYMAMTGWYVAEDTGNAVKGNIIDVFLGESAFHEMEKFGSRIVKARVYPPQMAVTSQKPVERK